MCLKFKVLFLILTLSLFISVTVFAVNFSDYFPVDPEKYGIKTYQWTFGKTGQFTSRIEGNKTVPYVSGGITGARVTNWLLGEGVGIICNDGINVKYLGFEFCEAPGTPLVNYYVSTDCSLTAHPSAFSFNALNEGMIIDQGTFYIVNSDLSYCESENQMILISIQDVKVLGGNYENAVIMWYLDTKYPFTSLDFHGKESDLGISLPTSSDTNSYSVTEFEINGFETGVIASGDIAASSGDLECLNELISISKVTGIKIPLREGWNLISFLGNRCVYEEAEPTVFIPEGTLKEDVGSLLDWLTNGVNSPIRDAADPNNVGAWRRITSFDENGARIIDRELPQHINTLKYLSVGYGYWIKMNQPGFFLFDGCLCQ